MIQDRQLKFKLILPPVIVTIEYASTLSLKAILNFLGIICTQNVNSSPILMFVVVL